MFLIRPHYFIPCIWVECIVFMFLSWAHYFIPCSWVECIILFPRSSPPSLPRLYPEWPLHHPRWPIPPPTPPPGTQAWEGKKKMSTQVSNLITNKQAGWLSEVSKLWNKGLSTYQAKKKDWHYKRKRCEFLFKMDRVINRTWILTPQKSKIHILIT